MSCLRTRSCELVFEHPGRDLPPIEPPFSAMFPSHDGRVVVLAIAVEHSAVATCVYAIVSFRA